MNGLVRLILVAGVVGAIVAANMAVAPGVHGNLPPRPDPHVSEASALDWSLFERTRGAQTASPRYGEELLAYDGEEVSLFGYVSLRRDGLDEVTGEVNRFHLSPGFHFVCCGTSGRTPVTQLRPETTVLVESAAGEAWTKPEDNPGLFVDAVGTLRLTGESTSNGEPIYRLEAARLAPYTLGADEESWESYTLDKATQR